MPENLVDTPQKKVENPTENFTIDDIIMGNHSEEAEKALGAEEEVPAETPKVEDATYQYWQSQADKRENENKELRAQLTQMNNKLTDTIERISTPVEKPEPVDSEGKFPPPPAKPVVPTNYSEEEATSDPNSTSANYVRNAQEWYDNMIRYNELKAEYANKRVDEFLEKQKERDTQAQAKEAQRKKTAKHLAGVADLVQQQYGATKEQAIEFVKTMSSPDSVSLENLWKLYSLQTGVQASGQMRPSGSFNQSKTAQAVPVPLGVMPSSDKNRFKSVEQIVMDDMIQDYNKSNPFK